MCNVYNPATISLWWYIILWLNLISELYFTFFIVYSVFLLSFTDICIPTGITKRPPPRPPAPKNSPLNLVEPPHSTVGNTSNNKDDINIVGETNFCKNSSHPLPSNEDHCETKSNFKQNGYVFTIYLCSYFGKKWRKSPVQLAF